MLYPVEKLLEGRGKPLCSQHDEKVKDALIKMVENNYSQLPIVDKEGNLTGVIAEQTITRSYYHLGEEISVLDLSVEHCQEPARSLTIDSDLFDVLDQLKSTYAVVIVDDRKPTGILTDYDTIHFFRDLYEGLILVEDIEINLRQIIESAFPTQEELDNALIITSGANKRDPSKPNKSYDRMTFGGYIYFIKNEKIWPHFEKVFHSPQLFFQYMDQVRDIRNQLSHFRGRPDSIQYDVLKRAQNWLATRPKISSLSKTVNTVSVKKAPGQTKGKYGPIRDWMTEQAKQIDVGYDIEVKFSELEKLIGEQLPPSARNHRAWWANKTVAPSGQSMAWLRAGWKVENVDFTDEITTFRRTNSVLYQLFFLDVLLQLKEIRRGLTKATHTYTQNFWSFGAGRTGFLFSWTFTSEQQLRVSLDIDVGDQSINKRIFSSLKENQAQIEKELEIALDWEQLPDNRASRISTSIPAHIDEPNKKLLKAQNWCLQTTLKFADTFKPKIKELKIE